LDTSISAQPTLDDALALLQRLYGYPAFRGVQANIIARVLDGGDALVLMPTGGGKSMCYQIPAVLRAGTGIVISPLIALMQDQVDALREVGVRAAFMNSSQSTEDAMRVRRELEAGELDLLYVAPERLLMQGTLELLQQVPIALFAIDEAHCVSQWGHDFRPEYRALGVLHELWPNVPRLALTATADRRTRAEIIEQLALGDAETFISSFDRPNLRYRITPKTDGKVQLIDFLDRHHGAAGIVYCQSRRKVDEIAGWLTDQGYNALPYHAGLDAKKRADHQRRFLSDDGVIIVATIAFGMGIDKPDVRFVVHLDLPKSIESYYQETGRAGRDGLPSEVLTVFGYGDLVLLRRFIDDSEASDERKQFEHRRLNILVDFCESVDCRRINLLAAFDEMHGGSCGNCDNCLEPPARIDGTVVAKKFLSAVYRTGQRFGMQHVIANLRGESTERMVSLGHDRVSTFGVGKDHTTVEWQSVARQLLAQGKLDVEPKYGTLRLNGASRAVFEGATVWLRVETRTPKSKKRGKTGGAISVGKIVDREHPLVGALRDWRTARATAGKVPPFVILHDTTLMAIASRRPANEEELGEVPGIGEKKIERYGAELLDLVRRHAAT